MAVYERHRERIEALVKLPKLNPYTSGKDRSPGRSSGSWRSSGSRRRRRPSSGSSHWWREALVAKVDTKRLIGEVAKRHGLLLDEDDPVLLTVTLCEFILDEYVEKLNVNLERAFVKEVDRARKEAETVVTGAIAQVADHMREAGAAVAADLERALGPQMRLARGEVAAARSRRRVLYCIAASVGATAFILGATLARFVCR
jgi:hypothetical protein